MTVHGQKQRPIEVQDLMPAVDEVDELSADGLVELATKAAAIHARAMARLASMRVLRGMGGSDLPEYLTVDEAADLLRVTPEWVYRKAAEWSFASKLAPKILRIQRIGLLRWIEQRARG